MMRGRADRSGARTGRNSAMILLMIGILGGWRCRTWAGSEKEAEKPSAAGPCAVTLGNGATVELVGVCTSPAAGMQWRTPGGAALSSGPCEAWSGSYIKQWAGTQGDDPCYEVVLRLSHQDAEGAGIEWRFANGSQTCMDIGHKPAPGLRAVFIGDYAKAESIDFQAAVATGPWKTDCVYTREQQTSDFDMRELADHTVIWQHPTKPQENRPGRLKLSVVHDYRGDYEVRVLAIGPNGKEVPFMQAETNHANKLAAWRGYYDADASDIAEFRLQVRPLYWVRVKDVCLRPGLGTQPKAERTSAPQYGQP